MTDKKQMILTTPYCNIAYDHQLGNGPCIIFCGGFNSNRQGNKAVALEAFCHSQNWEFIRFDYSGHGESEGEFAQGTISRWLQDTLNIIDEVAQNNPVVLVGSSMGGWIALLAALARPKRVQGLLLIACAADMTRYYPERVQNLMAEQDNHGCVYYSVPNDYDDQLPYRVYQQMIDDGDKHFLLQERIALKVPVHLVHGMRDDVVEWQRSQSVMDQLVTEQAVLHLIKDGDHRLSRANDLKLMEQCLRQLVQSIE